MDIKQAKEIHPFLMQKTAIEELKDCIALNDTYNEKQLVDGSYKATQLHNVYLKPMEHMFEDSSFLFDNDKKGFKMKCTQCSDLVHCMWNANKDKMILFFQFPRQRGGSQA